MSEYMFCNALVPKHMGLWMQFPGASISLAPFVFVHLPVPKKCVGVIRERTSSSFRNPCVHEAGCTGKSAFIHSMRGGAQLFFEVWRASHGAAQPQERTGFCRDLGAVDAGNYLHRAIAACY